MGVLGAEGVGNGATSSALFYADRNQQKQSVVTAHLASGLAVTSPVDDPSGYAVATNLQTQITSTDASSANVQTAKNFLAVTDAALATATTILQRMRTLALAADNSILSNNDRRSLQTEVMQLNAELNTIAENTQFNGIHIFQHPIPVSSADLPVIADAGFETPVQTSYTYHTTGSPWTFIGVPGNGSGLSKNGTAFTAANANAPEGTQVAFLQGRTTIKQSITGFQNSVAYTFSFQVSPRVGYLDNENFSVSLDGQIIGTYLIPPSHAYSTLVTSSIKPGAGNHTFTFTGIDTAGTDSTVFIDNVTVTGMTVPPVSIIHTGASQGLQQDIPVPALDASWLGVSGINLTGAPGNPASGPGAALMAIDSALQQVTTSSAGIGAASISLDESLQNNNLYAVNTQTTESAIRDLNVAKATTENTRLQLLHSFSQALLVKNAATSRDILTLFGSR